MPCGRQASDTFRPLFSTSPRMRMICSALCLFFMCLFCWFYPAKLSSKSVLFTGAGPSRRGDDAGGQKISGGIELFLFAYHIHQVIDFGSGKVAGNGWFDAMLEKQSHDMVDSLLGNGAEVIGEV